MTELNNAWVMNDQKRAAFWATSDDLELSEEETRMALGLGPDGSTKAYGGTLEDAMDAIAQYANRKRTGGVDTEGLPEAPVVVYSQALTKTGFEMNFTIRAKTWGEAMDLFGMACADIKSAGGKPLRNGRYDPITAPARESSSPKPPPSPPAETAPQSESAKYDPVKVGRVERIQVDPEGVIHFHIDGMQWPLHDHRGPDVVSGLFSEDAWSQQFPPAALSEPGYYDPEGLEAKYGRKEKGDKSYWDVLGVHRG